MARVRSTQFVCVRSLKAVLALAAVSVTAAACDDGMTSDGAGRDGGASDRGVDASRRSDFAPDAARPDAARPDAATPDAAGPDAQGADLGTDAETPDGGAADLGTIDLGATDVGALDATGPDAALGDVGVPALPACGPATAAGARHDDVPYGPDARQILDLYLTDRVDAATPVFVWVHGGGWEGGSHARVPQPALALLERGVAVVSVEYRLSDTPFPTTLSDVRAALRWLQTHAAEYGIDGEQMVVSGSSAGGHLVSILGTASEITALDLDPRAGPAPRPALVVDFFGPTDLLNLDADGDASGCPAGALCHDCVGSPEARLVDCEGTLSSCPEVVALASPLSHVDHNDSPFLLVHGALDCLVPPPQSQRMHAALQAVGVPSALIVVEDVGHNIGDVGTSEVWQHIFSAVDAQVLGCARPEMPVVPAPNPPIDDCRVDACPAEATACDADPACLALDACAQECRGAEGCRASCTAGVPGPVVQRHRALFECSLAAGCR